MGIFSRIVPFPGLWFWALPVVIFLQTGLYGKTLSICGDCRISSISEGLTLSSPGDTLIVGKGWYGEGGIRITKRVTLMGEEFPVIDAQSKDRGFVIEADSVSLSGFLIQNIGHHSTEDWAAIEVVNSRGFSIENNRIVNSYFGIYLRQAKSGTLSHNQITGEAMNEINSGNALHLWYCDQITVIANRVTGHRDGIYFEFVTNSVIRENVSWDNLRYGLHFMFSNNNRYHKNIFQTNGAGVAVMFSKDITMTENRFIENWGGASYGLLLKEITDSDIRQNVFTKNTMGIYAEGANRVTIEDNDFRENGWALNMLGSCRDNLITGNNFFGNTFEVTTNSSRHYNHYEKNYWSHYRGYDLDGDGYGDIAHRPVSLFSYLVSQYDASIILLRSPLADLINFAERMLPELTPKSLIDSQPLIKPRNRDIS